MMPTFSVHSGSMFRRRLVRVPLSRDVCDDLRSCRVPENVFWIRDTLAQYTQDRVISGVCTVRTITVTFRKVSDVL